MAAFALAGIDICWMTLGGLAAGQCAGFLEHDAFLPPAANGALCYDWLPAIAATNALAIGVLGMLVFTLQLSSRLDGQEGQLSATIQALERSRAAIQDQQARRSRFMLAAGIVGGELGLAIVREVVERTRGRIAVTSHLGEGATFRVTLPAADDALAGEYEDAGVLDKRHSVVVVTPRHPSSRAGVTCEVRPAGLDRQHCSGQYSPCH